MKATALSNALDEVIENRRAEEAHCPFGARLLSDYEGPIKRAARAHGVSIETLTAKVSQYLADRHARESRSHRARK
ncbi:hypothetical protein ERN12_06035 [Rhodobacteraceae bacterium]|nr:hypothetical protein ERN12_06035 [Paracoccaceae bacterium]